MEGQKETSLAFQKVLVPATGHPIAPQRQEQEFRLEVAVVFTSAPATIAALRKADALADRLNARIALVVPQVVPFPRALESPPVLLEFSELRCREIVRESRVETRIQIYLCRDRLETLKYALPAGSLVLVGGPRRWWPTREEALARNLQRAGHEVIFAEME